jgi:hypothetical protein
MAEQTQISGAAARAAVSSDTANNAGSESKQATTGVESQVDGKSGSSDETNGTAKDRERSRPSRAERRINQFSAKLKQAESSDADSKRLNDMLTDPISADMVRLPDYSKQDEVSPEQLKTDIINAADQIVKLRMQQILPENNRSLNQRQLNDRVLQDIDEARKLPELNPDDESYDADLEEFLAETFERVYKGDPTYRFRDLVAATLKRQSKANTSNKSAASDDDAPARAIRPSTSSTKAPSKPVEEMTADEYEKFAFKSRR